MKPARPTDGVLWVSHPKMMLETFGGIRVIERQAFTLARAGIKRLWIAAQKPGGPAADRLRWPDGLEVNWVAMSGDRKASCEPPYAGLSGDHVLRRGVLDDLLGRDHQCPTSYRDPEKKGVVQIVPFRSEGLIEYEYRPMPEGSCLLLQNPPDRPAAVEWLLADARKESDGFMARNFDRKISLAATRRLLRTGITPNQMTVFSSLIGVAGGLMMAGGSARRILAGALVVWLHTLLDGCDGELARLRFQESRWGGLLDFWGDNVVHFTLFMSLGVGLWRATGRSQLLVLGAVAAFTAVLSAHFVMRYSLKRAAREAKPGAPLFSGIAGRSWAARAADTLAQRDFVYLMVFLAAIGRADLFLLAAGVGSPLFLAGFLLLRVVSRD